MRLLFILIVLHPRPHFTNNCPQLGSNSQYSWDEVYEALCRSNLVRRVLFRRGGDFEYRGFQLASAAADSADGLASANSPDDADADADLVTNINVLDGAGGARISLHVCVCLTVALCDC